MGSRYPTAVIVFVCLSGSALRGHPGETLKFPASRRTCTFGTCISAWGVTGACRSAPCICIYSLASQQPCISTAASEWDHSTLFEIPHLQALFNGTLHPLHHQNRDQGPPPFASLRLTFCPQVNMRGRTQRARESSGLGPLAGYARAVAARARPEPPGDVDDNNNNKVHIRQDAAGLCCRRCSPLARGPEISVPTTNPDFPPTCIARIGTILSSVLGLFRTPTVANGGVVSASLLRKATSLIERSLRERVIQAGATVQTDPLPRGDKKDWRPSFL